MGNTGGKRASDSTFSDTVEGGINSFPNPSSDGFFNLNVTGFDGIMNIQVFDIGGR